MPVNYRIRQMCSKDLEAVTALEEECFSMPWRYNDFKEILTNPNRIYLLAELDDKNAAVNTIIGGCVLTDISGEGDISNVAVSREYRGNHIATALLGELIRTGTQEMGIKAFTLEVRSKNEAAIRLYKNLGFAAEGIRPDFYDKPKDDAVIMWKR